MRFIGSKVNLLDYIKKIIDENCKDSKSFCDIFSGTNSVARFFKKEYLIISNDLLYFSFVLQKATLENNSQPQFEGLKQIEIANPIKFLNDFQPSISDLKSEPFILNNYTPNKFHERSYFSESNALKIDFIRQTIEEWRKGKIISEYEYYYLVACLIESVPFVSNIAGTYGAYLKHRDKRSLNPITLIDFKIENNGKNNMSFNLDANELIKNIKGDILYLDPPYNSRQYLPNYHILETISKYDYPQIYASNDAKYYVKKI